MSEIPEEDNSAVAKRRAIQAVMRDASLTPVERNKKMQDIMAGRVELPSSTAPAPASSSGAAASSAAKIKSEIPEEDDKALAKRKAIQAVMRDKSLTPVERNKRMQDIMAGKFDQPQEPTSAAAAPARDVLRRGSSAKELIAKFEEASHAPPKSSKDVEHELSFGSVHSSGSEGRGVGLEERLSSRDEIFTAGLGASAGAGESTSPLSAEDKKKRAFISPSAVSKNREILQERVKANPSSIPRPSTPDDASPGNTQKPGAFKYAPKRTGSGTTLDQYEQRILQKSMTGASNGAGSPSGVDSGTTTPGASNVSRKSMAAFESRVLRKSMSTDSAESAKSAKSLRSVDKDFGSDLEKRIMEKTKSNNASVRSRSADAHADRLEQRILEKSRSGAAGVGASASTRQFEQRVLEKGRSNAAMPGTGDSTRKFEQRILEKTKSNASIGDSSARSRSSVNSSMNSFEQRILEKTKSNAAMGTSESTRKFDQRVLDKLNSFDSDTTDKTDQRRGSTALDGSMNSFEQRVLEKTKSNAAMSGVGDSTRKFEQRVIDKLSSFDSSTPNKRGSTASADSAGDTSFEARLQDKLTSSRNVSAASGAAAAASREGNESWQSAAVSDTQGSDSHEHKKRRAIKAIMQDAALDPQERNRRLQSVMAGTWEEESQRLKSSMTEAPGSGDVRSSFRTMAVEAKIAQKLRHRAEMAREHLEDEDVDREDEFRGGEDEDADAGHTRSSSLNVVTSEDDVDLEGGITAGNASPRRTTARHAVGQSLVHSSIMTERSADEDPRDQEGGLGFGSLPRPEEHFPEPTGRRPARDRHRQSDLHASGISRGSHPAMVEDPDDANFGLAVAQAVAPDDEPDYVYNAIEYDPEAKPPLHRNRRFRIYTYFALLMIAIVVVMVVVYITSASKADEINVLSQQHQDAPSISPTSSPLTDRQMSGIVEQLQGGVLMRNETFGAMKRGDPRLMALDWILHKDMMQLESDDESLYQRFGLAVLAYSMDSPAWYYCGDPGEDYKDKECEIEYYDGTKDKYGVWLSSTPECEWFGVTCSADDVVRAVELSNNDLIGTIPHELSALRFLQLLALPHNCIYGTIPQEIRHLKNLLSLELHGNGLSGVVPDSLYELDKLQLLNLAEQWGQDRKCNRTDGEIVDIDFRMGGLVKPLELNAGLTAKLGSKLGVFRSMKGLYLNRNSFEGTIPPDIGNMRYLRWLWLNDNLMEGSLPETMTKLRNLKDLLLGENFFISSFPSEFGRLSDIQRLTANGNSMFGELPQGLWKMKKLQLLRLDDTLMKEDPWLAVPDEGLTGTLSPLIGDMQDLRYLFLSNNPISGTIPTELGLCENLQVLRVHRTNIEGEMPREVCLLRDKNLNNEEGTGVLYSDCSRNNKTQDPFLKCDCCTDCCDHTTGVCVADD